MSNQLSPSCATRHWHPLQSPSITSVSSSINVTSLSEPGQTLEVPEGHVAFLPPHAESVDVAAPPSTPATVNADVRTRQQPIHLACLQRFDCPPNTRPDSIHGYTSLPDELQEAVTSHFHFVIAAQPYSPPPSSAIDQHISRIFRSPWYPSTPAVCRQCFIPIKHGSVQLLRSSVVPVTLDIDDEQDELQVEGDAAPAPAPAARPVSIRRWFGECLKLRWDVHSLVLCAFFLSTVCGAVAAGLSCGIPAHHYDFSYTNPSNYSISIGDCSYRNVSLTSGEVMFDYSYSYTLCPHNGTHATFPPLPSAWQPVASLGDGVCFTTTMMTALNYVPGCLAVGYIVLARQLLGWKALSFTVGWLLIQAAVCIALAALFWPAMNEITQGAVSSQLESGGRAYMAAVCIVCAETAVVVVLSLYFVGRSAQKRWAEKAPVLPRGPNP